MQYESPSKIGMSWYETSDTDTKTGDHPPYPHACTCDMRREEQLRDCEGAVCCTYVYSARKHARAHMHARYNGRPVAAAGRQPASDSEPQAQAHAPRRGRRRCCARDAAKAAAQHLLGHPTLSLCLRWPYTTVADTRVLGRLARGDNASPR